ncbi:MAG: transposase [Acidimicrobiales bacterium]
MARIPRRLMDDGWFHVMNRGARRLPIFGDDGDRDAFLRRLGEAARHHELEVHAYALMPNHFHLLVRGTVESLSSTMQALCSGYTQRFNTKYGLDGALLRGRYRTKPIIEDRYLNQVVRYIHRNPVTSDRPTLSVFRWTSHLAYLGVSPAPPWLSITPILDRFSGDVAAYRKFVVGGEVEPDRPILGSAPRLTGADAIEQALGVSSPSERELLRAGGRGVRNELRMACVLLASELTAGTAQTLADRYGFRSASSVRSATTRARALARTDPAFRALLESARQRLTTQVGTGV